MSEWLSALRNVPEGVTHAAGLITGLDGAFAVGFGRLGTEQVRALEAIGKTFSGTPLARPIEGAIAAVRRSEFVEKHFVALAAARAALQGAQHDALAMHAAKALGREKDGEATEPKMAEHAQEPRSDHAVWLESSRQWLMEIALAGFLQIGPEALLPFEATLDKLQGEPQLIRQASLLTGFQNELVASLPIAAMTEVPIFRWTDLWSRAMVLSARPPAPPAEEPVTGDFIVVGFDIRQHPNFVSAVAHGLLKPSGGGAPRLARATISAYKVDVLSGVGMWALFGANAKELLSAVKKRAAVKVQGMSLLSTGDFVWDDKRAEVGAVVDSMAEAAKSLAPGSNGAQRSYLSGIDRHPAQIAEPVYLENYTVQSKGASGAADVRVGAEALPIAIERIADAMDFSREDILGSSKLVGLLRFDRGRFSLQPIALGQSKKKEPLMAGYAGASFAVGGDAGGRDTTLGVLRERASRLLRKKS
jgi:hypothetical protein